MSKTHDNAKIAPGGQSHRRPWITVLKVFCWCVGILAVLCGIAVWIISYQLSPERITRLIENKASEYLHADIRIGKLDYKLFRTYPWFEFEIDSLTIVSKSLDGIPPQQKKFLPRDSDSLVFVTMLKGAVNVHGLMHEDFDIRNIEIGQPKINIVMVDDSINNFNILPSHPKVKKIPKLDISEIKISPPFDLNFFSLKDTIQASAEVESFYLARGSDKNYDIGFEGWIGGYYKEYNLPGKVPVKFNTGVRVALPDFSAKLNNLYFAVAGLALDAKGEINADKRGIDLREADINLKIDDIFNLLTYLPSQILEIFPLPKGLTGNLPLDVNVSLLSPFHISRDSVCFRDIYDLPPLTASVIVKDANLSFTPPHEKRVDADDIYFEALCNFNPAIPEETTLQIKELRMYGEGISLQGSASFDNLLGETQTFDGDFFFSSPLMKSLSYFMPKSAFNISGLLKGKIEFSGTARNLGKEGFRDLKVSGDLHTNSLNVNSSSAGNVIIKNLKSDYKAQIPEYPLKNYNGTKMAFDLSADSVSSRGGGPDIYLTALKFKMDAMDTISGTPDPNGDISLKLGGLKLIEGPTTFNAWNVALEASGALNSSGATGNYQSSSSPVSEADSILQNRVAHTPLELIYNGGGILQTVMNLLTLNSEVTIEKGNFKSPSYLYPVTFEGVDLSTNLNRFVLSAENIGLSNSSFSISGEMEGLKPFMTSYSATPLKVTADINFKEVDINELSWGYYGALLAGGEKYDSVFYVPSLLPLTSSDSTAVLIPRNIDAELRLRAGEARYMQYSFAPLSTDIIVKNGVATLSALTIGAPYCIAVVDWTYSTSQLDNIFMDLKADVKNFSFAPFYKVFPSLTAKTPEIMDFTGVINANIGCYFQMFPDMFMNSESLKGKFDIKGTDLLFARQGKIEKITHLMLIEGEEPIKIQNLDITGGFHDNILQINPFKIKFDNYQLEVGGVNNTAGDMYYHLALEKSPFHLPFGVTLAGRFKHPEIRLGGTHIKDYKAEMVSMNPDSKINVNIMAYLKHGWLLFIQEAAKYEGKKD